MCPAREGEGREGVGGERQGVTYVEFKAAPALDKITQNISRYRRLNEFQTVNSDFDRMRSNSCVGSIGLTCLHYLFVIVNCQETKKTNSKHLLPLYSLSVPSPHLSPSQLGFSLL